MVSIARWGVFPGRASSLWWKISRDDTGKAHKLVEWMKNMLIIWFVPWITSRDILTIDIRQDIMPRHSRRIHRILHFLFFIIHSFFCGLHPVSSTCHPLFGPSVHDPSSKHSRKNIDFQSNYHVSKLYAAQLCNAIHSLIIPHPNRMAIFEHSAQKGLIPWPRKILSHLYLDINPITTAQFYWKF